MADRIHQWMRTPMGAFRFVEETPHTLTLVDVAAGCTASRQSETPDMITTMPEFGMVTDVPHLVQQRLAVEVAWPAAA